MGTGSGNLRSELAGGRFQVGQRSVGLQSMWGFWWRKAEIILAQHSPPTHKLAQWNAGRPGGWGQAAKVSPGGTEAVKSCLSPFLQTISDISLDNTTLSRCRPQPPSQPPPRRFSCLFLGFNNWDSDLEERAPCAAL